MLILRTAISFTQAALADYLGVSRFAVGGWEVGNTYPKITHLKSFIALALEHGAFAEGNEAEEIRSLWQAAHQKVWLDELWLADLLVSNGKATPTPSTLTPAGTGMVIGGEHASLLQRQLQSTPFIGREAELAEIHALLSDSACRLLTLVGPGGIGKTRLALEVATRHASDYPDGVVYVELASVTTVNEIVSTIANALKLSLTYRSDAIAQILAYLHERRMLMVLDNFEHLLEDVELLSDILRHSPATTLLVTSIARLNLQGEWLFNVEGLSYPALEKQPLLTKQIPADLIAHSAIQLFMHCARQVQPDLFLYESTLAAMVRICQQVDGIPLAIELAAAGLRILPVDKIEEQIGRNLNVLVTTLRNVPARHRSLRAVFNHSWNLLSEPEQTILSRLAIFRGSFTLAGAAEVAGATHVVLTTLINKSLLRLANPVTDVERVPEPHFLLSVPIRAYALEKLAEQGELGSVQQKHAVYYLKAAEAVSAQWDNPAVEIAIEELDQELDNMRAALQWTRESGNSTLGLQLAGALWRFWRRGGYINEGRVWLEKMLALAHDKSDAITLRARLRALNGAAWLATDQHDFGRAAQFFEEAKTLHSALGEAEDDTPLLVNAALHSRVIGEYRHATSILSDAIVRLRALSADRTPTKGNIGLALYCLAMILREQGDHISARNLFEEGITFFRAISNREGMAQGQLGLSDLARDHGDVAQIRAYCMPSLAIFRESGTEWATGFALNNLALAAFLEDDLPKAYTYISESVALFRGIQNEGSLAEVLITLGRIQDAHGDGSAAQVTLIEALKYAWSVGPSLMIATALEELASVEGQLGRTVQAVRLLNVSSTLRAHMGTPVRPVDQNSVDRTLSMTRSVLGEATFAIVWSEASTLTLEKIVGPLVGDLQRNQSLPASRAFSRLRSAQEMSQPLLPPPTSVAFSAQEPRVDWGDALAVTSFYGRERELDMLSAWMVGERCRVVSVLGQGGIGKSALASKLMHQVAEDFEVVIWRSLRDVPTCEALLDSCLQVLAPETLGDSSASPERRQDLLLECLRNRRVLLVYDNLESFLEEGEASGRMRVGYEGAARVLRRIAETEHQSCLLLTSREKPGNLVPLEGNRAPVRSLRLAPLDIEACEALLAEKEVTGSRVDRLRLTEVYGGNPLALKIVAQTIVSLFDGEIASFLEQGELIFGGVQELLNEQFDRLSLLEQCALRWLAILREPAMLDELLALLIVPVSRARLLDAMESLHRRSLIDRGHGRGSFTLQSVVLEYMTMRIITEASDEILAGKLAGILVEHGLELAQSHEYIRKIQERLLVAPILERLQSVYPQPSALEKYLLTLLKQVAIGRDHGQGYGGANLVTLLHLLRGNLRGLDLSHQLLRNVSLQGIEMQDVNLAGAVLRNTILTEVFDSLTAVAISNTGKYWAASGRQGEVLVWGPGVLPVGEALYRAWQAHADLIPTLSFSPDGNTLATSGGWEGSIKLWNVTNGDLLWLGKHTGPVNSIAFCSDGSLLASSSDDAAVRIWNATTGTELQLLSHPAAVAGISWSPDGLLLVTGDVEGTIRLWEIRGATDAICVQTIIGHTARVDGLAFSPDGKTIASASWDRTVKLWANPQAVDAHRDSWFLLHTFAKHIEPVTHVAWSPDGYTLASCGHESSIFLWDVPQASQRMVLTGHRDGINGLTFTPDGSRLFSSSEDGTLHVWDIADGQSVRIIRGYASSLYGVDWSPDGTQLVSGGTDRVVTVYTLDGKTLPRILHGHQGITLGVGWSSDGRWLASSEWDNTLHIWDASAGTLVQQIRHPQNSGSNFSALTWSSDGKVACGTYRHGVLVWEKDKQNQRWVDHQQPTWIRAVAWNLDATRLAGGDEHGTLYLWNTEDYALIKQMADYHRVVMSLAWEPSVVPSGGRLASAGFDHEGGVLIVWDLQQMEPVHKISRHPFIMSAVAWGSQPNVVISGDSEGTLRWWDIQRGECLLVQKSHRGSVQSIRRSLDGTKLASCGDDGTIQIWDLDSSMHLQTLRHDRPYERMNIYGLTGITEAQRTALIVLGAVERVQ